MIIRSAISRQGHRALLAPVARSCHRSLSTSVLDGDDLKVDELTAAAALDQIPKNFERVETGTHWYSTPVPRRTIHEDYRKFRIIQNKTHAIGSKFRRDYVPSNLISDPPRARDVTLELLMASQTHMGHHTSHWNPANARYIYGQRQGIHLISLETTAAHLRRAARVVEEVAYRGGLILFVGNRRGQVDIVTNAARLAGSCHLFTKWTPGNITNRDMINSGKAIKVVDGTDTQLDGFGRYERTTRPLLPDLVICLNPLENYTMLYECGLANIPTIGVIDTDANPDWVTYTIPANDDSYRSIAVIAGVLGRAGQAGQKRRLADAENNVVAWQTPQETVRYMSSERARYETERKRWARDNVQEAEKSGEAQLLEMVEKQREKAMFGDEAFVEAEVDEELRREAEALKGQFMGHLDK